VAAQLVASRVGLSSMGLASLGRIVSLNLLLHDTLHTEIASI
jgi:hypothetical protein